MMRSDDRPTATKLDRRALLKLMAATGGGAALDHFGAGPTWAADPAIEVADPRYNQLYNEVSNYYLKDPGWVKESAARLAWPQAGEKVPELSVVIPTVEPHWLDGFRKWAADAEQIGVKWNIQ